MSTVIIGASPARTGQPGPAWTPEPTRIEVDMLRRLPALILVGVSDPKHDARAMRERLQTVIERAGFEFPRTRIIVHCSPAEKLRKTDGLDLAVALAILEESGQITRKVTGDCVVIGNFTRQFSLDGTGPRHHLLTTPDWASTIPAAWTADNFKNAVARWAR